MAGSFTCPILFEAYDDDPSSITDKQSSHLPVQSSKCSHRVCYSCLMSMKMDVATKRNKDPCSIKWLSCPVCREKTSFNSEKPIVDTMLCDVMRDVRRTNQNANNGVHDNANTSQQNGALPQEAGVINVNEGNVGVAAEPDPADHLGERESIPNLRRSKRSIQKVENYASYDSDEDSRFSAGEEDSLTHEGAEQDQIGPNRPTDDDDDDDDGGVFNKARGLYRIRQFVAASRTKEDKSGVSPSHWCIKNGYCASSDRVLVATEHTQDMDMAMEYLRSTDIETIKTSCIGSSLFMNKSKGALTRGCNAYKRFAFMEKNDIVAMLVPGPVGKGEAYFGVLTSNKLIHMNPDEASQSKFPAMQLLNGDYNFRGLMLREVQWLRKGYVRDLPGQHRGLKGAFTVPWLIESGPFWLDASKNVDMMKTQSFLDSTVPL